MLMLKILKYKMNFNEFYNQFEYIYGEDIELEDEDAAYKMAKKHDIAVLSDKDLFLIIKMNEDIAAALWTTWLSGEYSWDIVVNNKYQKQGLGKELVNIAIREYNESKDHNEDPIMRVDVINPIMKKILLQKGFKVESETPTHTMMTKN